MAQNKFSDDKLEEIKSQVEKESDSYDYFTRDYPFEVISSKYGEKSDGDTSLYVPSYQRKFVWNLKKQSRFIESVLLGVPLTPFLVSEDQDKKLEIIDGSQRIRTLINFYKNGFKLSGLEKLDTLNGAKYKDLPATIKRYFKNRDFKIIIVDEARNLIKQDIFNRINTSGEQLTDSEIRKGSYSGSFYDLVLELKDDDDFKAICPLSDKRQKRGECEELILRFFTYSDKYIEAGSDVAGFLNQYLKDMNGSDFEEKKYKDRFSRMVDFVAENFNNGFRKGVRNQSIPRVRFEAIAVGVYLALEKNSNLTNPPMGWIDSEGFKIQTTSDTSNGTHRLKDRIEFVRDGLLGTLDVDRLING